MQATAQRASATKPRAKQLTKAEQELKVLKAYIKKVTSSPADSRALLQRAGIIDDKGGLTEPYRS
jgi:hypothetical protein